MNPVCLEVVMDEKKLRGFNHGKELKMACKNSLDELMKVRTGDILPMAIFWQEAGITIEAKVRVIAKKYNLVTLVRIK